MLRPYLFDEFFASGKQDSISPFLTEGSKGWGKNLPLKTALFSTALWALALLFHFVLPAWSFLPLSFVYFLVGTPACMGAIEDLKHFKINIDVLMTLAAFLALFINSQIEGALLLVLFELSQSMEESVSQKALGALHQLHDLSPKFAHVKKEDGTTFEKSVKEIQVGETLVVKNGEIIPLDGIILEGSSSLDLAHLTGESLPIFKKAQDEVPAGGRNLETALTIQVKKSYQESTLFRIIQLITDAKEAKPKLEQFLNRFGQTYATSIIILTLLFALSFPFLLSMPFFGLDGSLYRSLAFLIAASPCALIIGAPTAYLSAISACAKKGILLKGGIMLDALTSCKVIAFDKTGTLTEGKLRCASFASLEEKGDTSLALSIAYGLEEQVIHPIAEAIAKEANQKKIAPAPIESVKILPGSGIQGTYQGKIVAIGHSEWITSLCPNQKEVILTWKKVAKEKNLVLSLLLIEKELFGFTFEDTIRTEAKKLIESLPLPSIMLTGDHQANAETIGKELGIKTILADLKPEDKLQKVAELSEKEGLIMVGDGINDAPALARSTVGISLGNVGSDTAIEASDIVLLSEDLSLISWLYQKATKTLYIVRQNLILALSIIAFVSLPALFGLVPLWLAVLMHEGGTVLVGLNSLRLLRK